MRDMEEFEDEKIKAFFAKDKVMREDANMAFDSALRQISEMENKKQNERTRRFMGKWMTAAACLLIMFVGVNSYARTQGYNNIFFMIKEVFEDKKIPKGEIFSDRDIVISYQSFYITDDIEMQVNKLQIKENTAKLYLYVKEGKRNNISPFKYKVYNENGKLAYEGMSSKKKDETEYRESLNLKNYENEQNVILKVFSNEDKLLKTVTINLEEKTLEARTESIEVQKISQIKLNEFLSEETLREKDYDEDIEILILKLTDIAYSNSGYIVKYLYSEVTEEDIQNSEVENLEVYEGMARFIVEDGEFKLIS